MSTFRRFWMFLEVSGKRQNVLEGYSSRACQWSFRNTVTTVILQQSSSFFVCVLLRSQKHNMQKLEQFRSFRTRFQKMGYCSYRNPTVTQAPNGIELKRSVTNDHMPNMVENSRGAQKLFSD